MVQCRFIQGEYRLDIAGYIDDNTLVACIMQGGRVAYEASYNDASARPCRELAVLQQPKATTVSVLANRSGFYDSAISVTFAPNTKGGLVCVANLSPLQADQTLSDVAGQGRLIETRDEPFSAYQAFRITMEPGAGTPPTPLGRFFLAS